jgi:hypothetical protein
MENHGGIMMSTDETSDSSTRALWQPYQRRHLVESRRNGLKGMRIYSWEVFLFILPGDFLHTLKSYDMESLALLPLQRKVCCGILLPLKNSSPQPGMNLRSLGPMASTITITPPRRLAHRLGVYLCIVLIIINEII